MTLVSIQCGSVADLLPDGSNEWWDKPWQTAFHKQPVAGPVHAGALGLAGDAQADLANHGGPDKAICVYPAAHYPHWRRTLNLPDLPQGAFGENFTLADATEDDVCIGDVFRIGSAVVQISQPRQPCWKLARRWRVKDLAAQVERTGWTGWYFRVLQPGEIAPGQPVEPVGRPHPEWRVSLANEIMHHRQADHAAAAALAACPALSASWRESLSHRSGPAAAS